MSTYQEIRSLIDQLDDSKIRQRRAAGERLHQMLSQPDVRRRLALEANPSAERRGKLSIHAARRKALNELMRLIVQAAVHSAQSIAKGKSKATTSDIMLPYYLLMYCDTHEDPEDQMSISSALSRKEVKLFFLYCIEMLEDDDVVAQSELQLLEMLGYVCSRRDYVAYFRPHVEVQRVMEEVEKRLISNGSETRDYRVVGAAGSLFERIVSSTTQLGIGLPLLLPACVKMIAKWCATTSQDEVVRPMEEIPHLIGGLALLLRSDPEQSVAPITRHGRAILRFCKQRYVGCDKAHRIRYHEYFLAHLIVAQTAGRLQGLMNEDLGNLGAATLTTRQLSVLLRLAVGDVEKGDVHAWPIASDKRLALELAARLLACSQRVYHSQASWDAMEDPLKELVAILDDMPQADDFMSLHLGAEEHAPCPYATLASSPFFEIVVGPLFESAVDISEDASSMDTESPSGAQSALLLKYPVLNSLPKTDRAARNDRNYVLSSLQLLGASAELYPTGACWLSSSKPQWYDLPDPDDPGGHVRVRASLAEDLALVVRIVAALLKRRGESSGDLDIQRNSILCLCRLTTSTAVHTSSLSREDSSASLTLLQDAWREVWSVLFQPDLQYLSWTKSVSANSNGELLIQLLTAMVRRGCCDVVSNTSTSSRQMSFLYTRQQDLWHLPIFSSAGCSSEAPFALVYAIVHRVGLSEEGNDAISSVEESVSRRRKLLEYCVRSLETIGVSTPVGAISACISALAHGNASALALVVGGLQSSVTDASQGMWFTPSAAEVLNLSPADASCLLSILWSPLKQCDVNVGFPAKTAPPDAVMIGLRSVALVLGEEEERLLPVDFVARLEADQLVDTMREKLEHIETCWHTAGDEVEDPDGDLPTQSMNNLPLPLQTLILKSKLTVLLSRDGNRVNAELLPLSHTVGAIYQSVGNNLPLLSQKEDELCGVLDDLIRITLALIELASSVGTDIGPDITEGAMVAYKASMDLLALYVGNRDVEDVPMPRTSQPVSAVDDLFDDPSFETGQRSHTVESVAPAQKRKRSNVHGGGQKRRAVVPRLDVNGPRCKVLLASFVISLNPSYEVCELVARAMLGVDDLNERIDSEYEIDLLGGFFAARLICTKATLLRRSAIEAQAGIQDKDASEHSVVSLACKIIRLVRFAAGPNSVLHLHGYEHCARIVQVGDNDYMDSCLLNSEAKDVASLLKDAVSPVEQRSLLLRPHLRLRQLEAAVSAFRAGRDTFHKHFDRDFPRAFVLPRLSDLNGGVRRLASVAVVEAIRLLPEDKVIDSVRRHMAPLWQGKVEEEIRSDYRKWYSNKDLGIADENTTAVEQAWEDAFSSMQWGTMDCLSVVACVSSSSATTGRILFDLVQIPSSRPDLDVLCFQMLERMATRQGFDAVEDLLEANCDVIMKLWLENGISLHKLPLAVTAPRILRKLLRAGQAHLLASDSSGLESDKLRQTTASEYISTHCHVALPRILYKSLASLMDASVTRDFRRQILEDGAMKELCSVFYDRFGDDEVKLVFRRRLADIAAFTAVLHSRSEKDQLVAKEIERLMNGLLSEETVQRLGARSLHVALRRLLSTSSQLSDIAPERMLLSFKSLVETFGNVISAEGNPSRGTLGTTELLVFAKFCLSKSPEVSTPAWRPIQISLDFIAEQATQGDNERVHLGFSTHVLLDLLLDEKLVPVRGQAIDALRTFVNIVCSTCGSSENERAGALRLLKEVFVVVASVHESCQTKLHAQLKDFQNARGKMHAASLGLLRTPGSGPDAWGWSSEANPSVPIAFDRYVTASTVGTLKNAFELLDHVLTAGEGLGLKVSDIPGFGLTAEEPSTRSIELAGIDKRYALSNLLVGRMTLSNGLSVDDKRAPQGSPRSVDPTAIVPLVMQAQNYSRGMSAGQLYLRAELSELEQRLRRIRFGNSGGLDHQRSRWQDLARDLRIFCSLLFSKQVRLSAARCLGEMNALFAGPHSIEWPLDTDDTVLDEAIRSGRLLLSLQARCIERLVVALRSSDTLHSVIASETLRTLLVTRNGSQSVELVRGHDLVDMLRPFFAGSGSSGRGPLLLSDREIESLGRTPLITTTADRSLWCWDEMLWRGARKSSFESWICVLIPALLIGNYRASEESSTDAQFFSLCERMSCVDPEFAASLFPAIVVDLLMRDAESSQVDEPVDPVLFDTWLTNPRSAVLQKLSRGFGCLLETCIASDSEKSQGRRAVELAVDTLDVLRKITQHRFSSSRNHKRNTISSKSTSKGKDPATQKSPTAAHSRTKVSWQGIPYGLVLRLDGLLVAKCCLTVGRYASAMFYAEMYADARFGGSTKALDVLFEKTRPGPDSTLTGDVSGFCASRAALDKVETMSLSVDGLRFLSALQSVFSELGEQDSREAVDRRVSDLKFVADSSTLSTESTHFDDKSSMHYLQALDNESSQCRRKGEPALAVSNCFDRLGLRDTLETYIHGLTVTESNRMSDLDRYHLKEKWFECRLFDMQWDDKIFSQADPVDAAQSLAGARQLPSVLNSNGSRGFFELTTTAMSALQSEDFDLCSTELARARDELVESLATLGAEGIALSATAQIVDRLQALNDLERVSNAASNSRGSLEWAGEGIGGGSSTVVNQDFSSCVREVALRSMYSQVSTTSRDALRSSLISHLWSVCEMNLDRARFKSADGALRRLYAIYQNSSDPNENRAATKVRLRLQEARLVERRGNFSEAIRLVKQTITRLQGAPNSLDSEEEALLADALVSCGKWMTQYKVLPATTIMTDLLLPGSELAKTLHTRQGRAVDTRRATTSLLALGQLVSTIFETSSSRVKSLEWQRASQSLAERKIELNRCDGLVAAEQEKLSKKGRASQSKTAVAMSKQLRELQIYRQNLRREMEQSLAEREKILDSVSTHRILALRSFVSALSIADSEAEDQLSKHVYRLVGLWFSDDPWNQELDETVADAVEKVPSFRYVQLTSQLFARLEQKKSSVEDGFQLRLQQLVLKMCLDHPYHCLIQLIALANGNRVGLEAALPTSNVLFEQLSDSKAGVAATLITQLKTEDGFVSQLLESYQTLTEAYYYLAMVPTNDHHRGGAKIATAAVCKSPSLRLDQCLGTGSRLVDCPPCVFTKPPPLRPGCDYGGGLEDPIGAERVATFENHFSITEGGLHRPKIVMCIGSKGGRYRQLVKGEDEMRQDAVMEQVFEYVNEIMAEQHSKKGNTTGHRSLKVITYNIVPLSPKSGVLEWVEHAVPFGDYMFDKSSRRQDQGIGAHSRYYPGEWGVAQCREVMKKDATRKSFDRICENHSPCFRYFFVERFGHSTEAWYKAKTRYTRSVAVNSIVGHILGIGDRHTSNILVHQKTGEVVQIDFGIVFEQGKLLNTPERVPFRLTRNIVDGMGPLGIEGVFTSAAQHTLGVLRRNASALLTILSAVVSDPLYRWSMSPVKARQRQRLAQSNEVATDLAAGSTNNEHSTTTSNNETDTNEGAARAIAKIHEKLQGYEDGTSGEQQSLEGQVQLLINSACDPDNLCQMFPGWAPFA